MTGVNQSLACHSKYRLSPYLKDIAPLLTTITFDGTGKNNRKMESIGTVFIIVLLQSKTFADYRWLLIAIDLPKLLGIQIQMRLGMKKHKDMTNPHARMEAAVFNILLILNFGGLYYETESEQTLYMADTEYLFSMDEQAQVDWNIKHASAGSVYSLLRHVYHIKTVA